MGFQLNSKIHATPIPSPNVKLTPGIGASVSESDGSPFGPVLETNTGWNSTRSTSSGFPRRSCVRFGCTETGSIDNENSRPAEIGTGPPDVRPSHRSRQREHARLRITNLLSHDTAEFCGGGSLRPIRPHTHRRRAGRRPWHRSTSAEAEALAILEQVARSPASG